METMMKRPVMAATLLALLAGCGDDEVAAPAEPAAPAGTAIRVAEFEGRIAKCEPDEIILNAYCFVKSGLSFSASTVIFAVEDDGNIEAECMSGGQNIKLFCIKKCETACNFDPLGGVIGVQF
jgi:hypothetical protein